MAAGRTVVFQPVAFPYENTNEINSLAFSPDGRRLAFGYGTDAEVTLWNLETGKLAWQRHVEASSGGPIEFDPHGRFLVARFLVARFRDPDETLPIIASTLNGRRLGIPTRFQEDGDVWLRDSGRFTGRLVVSCLKRHHQKD